MKTTATATTEAHLELVRWADRFGQERRWAAEDRRHLLRRLEADPLAAGQEPVRLPPTRMAHAETADVRRFRSKDAFARHNGTAPLPVWSADRTRHRLSRTGNRQLHASIHRTAVTEMRSHAPATSSLERRRMNRNTKTESLRALKRKLSDVVYRALLADPSPSRVAIDEAA